MNQIRKSNERGLTEISWLKSLHSFSFGNYNDPEWNQFGPLRVINEDHIAASGGFRPHPHADMEIITIVMEGQLKHQDSMGNGSIISKGQVQYMSAGRGIQHSEFNPSDIHSAHIFQIWIEADQKGYEPRYEEKNLSRKQGKGWKTILSGKDIPDTIHVRQDIRLDAGIFGKNENTSRTIHENRKAWLQVASGKIKIGEQVLEAGDALAVTTSGTLKIDPKEESELFFFDLF